nr:hypothetical protein GCM10020092_087740 [Actinoplanes digitatis]
MTSPPAAGVAGAKITVDEKTSSPGNLSTELTTDANGVATLKAVPAGIYALRIKTPQGWTAEVTGAQTNISAKPATVTFKLKRNGEPTAAPTTPSASASATPVPTATAAPAPGEGGGLPVTGSNAALVVGTGLGLVVIGGAAFLTARRRRTRFVSSN